MIDFTDLYKMRANLKDAISNQDLDRIKNIFSVNDYVNLNYLDKDGHTPLHRVCMFGNLEICKFLVDKGASQNIKNKEGWFPIHIASYFDQPDILAYLLDEKSFKSESIITVFNTDSHNSLINSRRYSVSTFKQKICSGISNYRLSSELNGSTNSSESDILSDSDSESENEDEYSLTNEGQDDNDDSLIDINELFMHDYLNDDLIDNFSENDLLMFNLLDLKHLENNSHDLVF